MFNAYRYILIALYGTHQKQLTTKSPYQTKSFVHKPSVCDAHVYVCHTILSSNTLFAACIFRKTLMYTQLAHIIPELNCSLLIPCACGRSFCCPFLCRQRIAAARGNLIYAECTLNFNIVIVCWTEYSISKLSGDYDDGRQVNSLLFVCTLSVFCPVAAQYTSLTHPPSHIEIRNNRTPYWKGRSHIAIYTTKHVWRGCSVVYVGWRLSAIIYIIKHKYFDANGYCCQCAVFELWDAFSIKAKKMKISPNPIRPKLTCHTAVNRCKLCGMRFIHAICVSPGNKIALD